MLEGQRVIHFTIANMEGKSRGERNSGCSDVIEETFFFKKALGPIYT